MTCRVSVLGRNACHPGLVDIWCLVEEGDAMWVEYRWYRPTALSVPNLGKRRYSLLEFSHMPGAALAKQMLTAILEERGLDPAQYRAAGRPSAEIIPFPPPARGTGRA
jgi:hypothetical protein